MKGPPPDPNALRRERPSDRLTWTTLPSAGRKGKAPPFPLITPSVRELAVWRAEWKRPQAVMWEALGLNLEVGMYVRTLVDAEKAGASVACRNLVRQQQEALGLSLIGLARLRWRIEEPSRPKRRTTTADPSIRDRLRAIDGGGLREHRHRPPDVRDAREPAPPSQHMKGDIRPMPDPTRLPTQAECREMLRLLRAARRGHPEYRVYLDAHIATISARLSDLEAPRG